MAAFATQPRKLPQQRVGSIAFELCNDKGGSEVLRTLHEQMHVVRHNLHRPDSDSEPGAFLSDERLEAIFNIRIKQLLSIFGTPNEVIANVQDAMRPVCVFVFHTDKFQYICRMLTYEYKLYNFGGRRKLNQAHYLVKDFCLFDKVLYNGTECFVFGRRSTGSFDVRLINGNKVQAGVNCKKLRFLEVSRRFITTTKRNDAIPLPSEGGSILA